MTTVLVLVGLWLAVSVWLIATVAPPGGRRTLESLYGEVPAPRDRRGQGSGRLFPEAEFPPFDLWRSRDEPTGGEFLAGGQRRLPGATDTGLAVAENGQRVPTLKKRTRLAAKKVAGNGKRAYRETGLVVG